MTISSPLYPYEYPSGANCIYLLKSPSGTKIQLQITDLDLQKTHLNFCLDSLELRYYHLGQPGPIFCGTFTHQNQLELISYKNMVMIIFKSDWIQARNRRGFRLKAEYVIENSIFAAFDTT
ncbi:blastula protease 10-like [Brachionus plicatilis]|uniref:Blastula protease 10-like n=1 Tax=Brachionus plicatilis TaxID=10195 RepID=A0A3M7REP8_BRAPC|nr:blastula protease 10-like [Brachionus plicatilis]